jgi:hypothetical protein
VVILFFILHDPHHTYLLIDQCFPLDHELDLHLEPLLVHPLDLAHDLVWVEQYHLGLEVHLYLVILHL